MKSRISPLLIAFFVAGATLLTTTVLAQSSAPEPFARGINSFQLWNDGNRWWVITIFWEGESPGNPIPAKYLGR